MIDSSSLTFLIIVIVIAFAFEFANGFNDAANAIATVVSTRVMSPLAAVIMVAILNFVGAITGTAVAKAVAKGVVDPDGITQVVVAGGVATAALWVFPASRYGMPVSGSHSLIAGVVGASVAHNGIDVLQGAGELWRG
jgi:PiT family inorganic phosphate transporter